jgi:hypothetical protein
MNATELDSGALWIGVQDVDLMAASCLGVNLINGLHQHCSQLSSANNSYACHVPSIEQKNHVLYTTFKRTTVKSKG